MLKKLFFLTLFFGSLSLYADEEECSSCCKGRVDVGPAFASIDMLESGHTVRTLNLWGVRGDATILIWKGLCLKPSGLWVTGKANLGTGAIGLGFCIPVMKNLVLTPSIGVNETHYKSRLDFPDLGIEHVREKFMSQGVYLSLDACWTFAEGWRISGLYQYAWSRVHTRINLQIPFLGIDHISSHNTCQGPNYALMLERDFTDCFSMNIAGAYNTSLSREKHGLRGKGMKIGFVYWF